MAKSLRLAPALPLPLDAVTQTFGILGKRGSGKTNTASVLTEQFIMHRLPVVYVDPIGVTWGFKYSRDGKGPGLPVVIIGGEHADVPLEETGGAVIADFLIEHRVPTVLDLGLFSKGAQRRFMVDFAERLYLKNRSALHVMLDECDTFVPQRIDHGGERLVGAINDLVRKGRARGLGVTLISQRPALVNKDVLTQVETLIAHRMTGPQDRDAIERWIEHNANHVTGDTVLASLQELVDGEAWVWSPSWLGILKRMRINLRETFDSSATPKAGARVVTPKHAAAVDLAALRTKLAATIEKKKADDPNELKRQIAELKKQLAAKPTVVKAAKAPKQIKVPIITPAEIKRLEALEAKVGGHIDALAKAAGDIRIAARERAGSAPAAHLEVVPGSMREALTVPRLSEFKSVPVAKVVFDAPKKPARSAAAGDVKLGAGELKVLTAVAQHSAGVTREQVTILTGYKRSTRDAYIYRLVQAGLVLVRGDVIDVTTEGTEALGPDFTPLPVGDALREWWLPRLPEGERRVLKVALEAFPNGVDREHITAQTDYKRSTRDAYIYRLSLRKLVEVRGGTVVASGQLFS